MHTTQEMSASHTSSQQRRTRIIAYTAYSVITDFGVTLWVVYLAIRGYSPFAIGLLETLFHAVKFLAEAPTGIFADLVGRRVSLIIANALNAISNILLIVPGVPFVIASFVLSGVAYAFRGGAGDALLWNITGDSADQSIARRYASLYTRIFVLASVGGIIGNAVAGYISQQMLVLPFIIQAVLLLIGAVFLAPVPEQRAASHTRSQPFKYIINGLQIVRMNRLLLLVLLYASLLDSIWQTVYFYIQLFFHGKEMSLGTIGLIVAASLLCNLIFISIAPWLLARISRKTFLTISGVCMIIGLLAMGTGILMMQLLGYLLFFQAANGLLIPFMSVFINEHAPESHRATVLSLQTGLFSLAMVILFPLFGWIVRFIPYQLLYLWLGCGLLLISLYVVWLTRANKELNQ